MTIGDRIKSARESIGMTQEELGKICGVTKQTIFKYENNIITNIPLDKLKLISIGLNISAAALMDWETEDGGIDIGIAKVETGMSEDEVVRFIDSTPPIMMGGFSLSASEQSHIKKYRTLDGYGKDAVQAILDIEYNRCAAVPEPEDEAPRVISLRLSEQSAAAGTGTYLGPECFRTIYVRDSELARRAAYCIPVSGDSMEPVYYDGDILLVSSEQAEIGDIGIFTLSGKGYVKKLGNDVLLSLNGKYVPIPMDESIVCNGKVIGVLDKSEIVSNER